jgi:uncharacterized protein YukE
MTFKHTKFQDSQIMRSLEKVAVEKGLVKPEESVKSIHKTASNNLAPSGNLTEDIIKLCAGLRADGFGKYAEEIESKFIMFKQADTLYQTSKETGEDLVDAAHPEGSHKLEGLDHKVLTIVDRKKEIEKIVNKQPIGKLATNKEILNAVKKALAADPPTVENPEDESEYAAQIKEYESAINGLKSKIQSSITSAKSLYTQLKTTTDPLLNWNIDSADNFFKSIDKLVTDIRDSDFSEVNEKLSKLYNRLEPESGVFADSGVPSADWTGVKTQVIKINAQIQKAYNFFEKAKRYKYALVELKSKEAQESATIDFESLKPLKKRTREAITSIDGYFQDTSVTKLPQWQEQWASKLSQYKKSLEDDAKLQISNIKRDPDNSDSFIEEWSKNLDYTISNLQVLYQDIEKIKQEYSNRSTSSATPSAAAPASPAAAPATPAAPSSITIDTVRASMKELQDLIRQNKAKINSLKDINEKNKYNDLEGKIPKWTTLSEDQLLKTFRSKYKDLQSINNALQARIDRLQQLFGGVELADDGLISLNTINAIKALKIALADETDFLGENTQQGEDTQQQDDKKYSLILLDKYLSSALSRITSFENSLQKLDLEYLYSHARNLSSDKVLLERAKKIILDEKNNVDNFKKSKSSEIQELLYDYLSAYNRDKNSLTPDESKVFDKNISSIAKAKDDIFHAGNIAFGDIDEYNQSLIKKIKDIELSKIVKQQEEDKRLMFLNNDLETLIRKSKSALSTITEKMSKPGISGDGKKINLLDKLKENFNYIKGECDSLKTNSTMNLNDKNYRYEYLNKKYNDNLTSLNKTSYWVKKDDRVEQLISAMIESIPRISKYNDVLLKFKKLQNLPLNAKDKEDEYDKLVAKYQSVQ